MHVFITGGCGFIGSHIADYHLSLGDSVHVIDDLSTGSLENINSFKSNPKFTFDQADIVTWSDLNKSIVRSDLIYHMAAVVGVYRVLQEPKKVISTNIAGTERIIRSVDISGTRQRLIIASSSEVYGHSQKSDLSEEDHLIVESAAQPRWSYAIAKLADEALGIAYHRDNNMKVTMIRLFNTIGPRQTGRYGMVVPNFVNEAIASKPITVFGDGTQTRCFCDVRDVVRMLYQLACNEESIGKIVNVGHDREMTINELAFLIKARAKSNSEIIHIPYNEAYTEKFVDIKRRKPNLDELKRLIKFEYKWTLEKTIDDLIERSKVKIPI